jgi:hypothetical protein
MEEAKPAPARYFAEFLPTILDKLLIEDLRTLTTCFEIRVTDAEEPPWRLGIDGGRLTYVGHEGPEPVCRFSLDSDTFREVVSARCTPSSAFFDTRIDLEGDMEMGLKLSTVLEPFFHRFPFRGSG